MFNNLNYLADGEEETDVVTSIDAEIGDDSGLEAEIEKADREAEGADEIESTNNRTSISMTTTFILSEAKFRQFTDVNDMLDTALIKNAIREAQDISFATYYWYKTI